MRSESAACSAVRSSRKSLERSARRDPSRCLICWGQHRPIHERPARSKAELLEEMRELEERLEHLSAATAEGVFVHENGRILYLNQSGAEMYGFGARGAPEPRRPRTGPVRTAGRRISSESRRAGREPYETVGLRKDGTTISRRASRPQRRRRTEDHPRGHGRDLTERARSGAGAAGEPGALPLDSRESARHLLPRRAADRRLLFLAGSVSEIVGRDPAELRFGNDPLGGYGAPRRSKGTPGGIGGTARGRVISTGDLTYRILRRGRRRRSGSATCPGRHRRRGDIDRRARRRRHPFEGDGAGASR